MTNAPRLWLSLFAAVALCAIALLTSGQASADGQQPDFLLPWQDGQTWKTGTAGFHYTNDALDFFPPDTDNSWEVHCEGDPDWVYEGSAYWILASAGGTVVSADTPYVLLDHGGGWFSRYYHLDDPQVSAGELVEAGTRLGHPSTRGDCTTGPHVHFWVQGPKGETTKNVSLSGIPTTDLGVNEPHSETSNVEPGDTPSSTPLPTATFSPGVTTTPGPSGPPTPTPAPIPGVFPQGDANCDGLVTPADAILILQFAAGITSSDCAATHSETDCDGTVTVGDAMTVLQQTLESAALPAKTCATSTSTATAGPTGTPTSEPTVAPTEVPVVTEAPTATLQATDEPAPTEPGGPTPRATAPGGPRF